jgi:hypothetical protein
VGGRGRPRCCCTGAAPLLPDCLFTLARAGPLLFVRTSSCSHRSCRSCWPPRLFSMSHPPLPLLLSLLLPLLLLPLGLHVCACPPSFHSFARSRSFVLVMVALVVLVVVTLVLVVAALVALTPSLSGCSSLSSSLPLPSSSSPLLSPSSLPSLSRPHGPSVSNT